MLIHGFARTKPNETEPIRANPNARVDDLSQITPQIAQAKLHLLTVFRPSPNPLPQAEGTCRA